MRTTLTLDADVARLVEDAVHRARSSMKQVINDALRRALSQPRTQEAAFEQRVHEATLAPGLDLAGFNRMADELEDQAIIASMNKRGA
ncbi:antitoxin [Nocardia sp. NPDC058497]|uniref:antitoxin n=1 Tax=Nocardia sp. NPDC058497 TaxID=3346529 RepID=UPI00366056D8